MMSSFQSCLVRRFMPAQKQVQKTACVCVLGRDSVLKQIDIVGQCQSVSSDSSGASRSPA